MFKLLYVLTDDEKMHYCTQLLISLSSLKKHTFNGQVFVLTDDLTENILSAKGLIQELRDLGAELIIAEISNSYSQAEKSRYLKTSLPDYISGDFLYIDTDTIIADNIPNAVSDAELAMVQDKNWKQIDNDPYTTVPITNRTVAFRSSLAEQLGYSLKIESRYFNSGVMWVRDTDTVHKFFTAWHNEWERCRSLGINRDQPSLNALNYKFGHIINELDGEWNVQVACPMALRFLNDAIVLHYFNFESVYKLGNPEIQKGGYKSEAVQEIINNPKYAFYPYRLMPLNMVDETCMYSRAYNLYRQLYIKHRKIYNGINRIASFLIKTKNALKKL